MTDHLEESLRQAFSHRTAQLAPDSMTRLTAIDYHPRRHRIGRLPAIGAMSTTAVAAAVAAVVALGSGAAPAFAGWQATPSTPTTNQLGQAAVACGQGLGDAVLTDARGPYTLSIYANSTTNDICLTGNGVTMSTSAASASPATVAPGQIELGDTVTRDLAGKGLTLVEGRVGSDVTAVTIDRNDGSSVDATVANGWYVAWWPGTVPATDAVVTTASGDNTLTFPAPPAPSGKVKPCPSGALCASGYSDSGDGPATSQSTVSVGGTADSSN